MSQCQKKRKNLYKCADGNGSSRDLLDDTGMVANGQALMIRACLFSLVQVVRFYAEAVPLKC